MLDIISNIIVVLFGVPAVYFLSRKEVKIGCILGLISEIGWFVTSVHNHQWGIVVLAFVYLWVYASGLYKVVR